MRLSLRLTLFCFSLLIASRAVSQPRINVEGEPRIDLGTLYEGQTRLRKLTISNDGDSTLKIKRVWTSCGCTAAKLSSNDIRAGQRETLSVTFDTKDLQGPFKREVHISSNDTAHAQLDLKIEGTIIPIVTVTPRYVTFDRMKIDHPDKKTVEITNTVKDTIHIRSYKTPEPQMRLSLDSRTLPPGKSITLGVEMNPTKKGNILGQIEMLTDNKLKPVIKISYIGLVK